jgi:hypothetical protein
MNDLRLIISDAQPGDVAEVDLDGFRLHQRLRHQAGIEGHDRAAVARQRGVEIAHRGKRSGAGRILDDDGRVARNMFSEVAGDRTRVDVVPAARGKSDHDGDGLALVEISLGMSGRRRGRRQGKRARGGHAEMDVMHGVSPVFFCYVRRQA